MIDLGDGEAVCFKVESHNHPSAVEPFQGAATGVGGILRDIIAMGARPVALLNGLYFAEGDPRFDRAVAGIGGYGNSVGVPTVGGEVCFDDSYADNVLVNAMCVGLLPTESLTRAGASGPGNLVVLYGATTGRDGIGGASVLASQELGEDDADKRPTVQVGDPFTGNKLIEVSVELVEGGLVESLQDCGAAGLASSLSEMARETGIDLRLDRVPLREEGMEPWEVMISESQERMVAVVRPQMLEAVEALCERWGLRHAVIGEVTDSGLLRALWEDEVVGEIPARLLTDECPRYEVEPRPRPEPAPVAAPEGPELAAGAPRAARLAEPAQPRARVRTLRPSRRLPHRRRPGPRRRRAASAAQATAGSRSRSTGREPQAGLDPRAGGALAVLEAARNVACTGAEPLGLTDCLNFGNPEKPEIAWELAEAIEGMAEACEALGVPVVSGNVSLYNETDGRAIRPTPVVGCVGLLAGRPRRAAGLARRRRRPPRRRLPRLARRLRVPGAVRRGRRAAGAARPHGRGRARRVPLAGGAELLAGPRRVRGRAGRRARRGRRSGAASAPSSSCPRIRAPGSARAAGRPCSPARPQTSTGSAACRCGGSASSAAKGSSGSRSPSSRRAWSLVCGVFGVRSEHRDVARLTYFGLFALQHRGQESAGIAVSEGGRLTVLRDMGLVAQAFDEEKLQALPGDVAIGHTRYSTTGSTHWSNAQPLVHHGSERTVAIGHNGNLTNTTELRAALQADGIALGATSDTEVIAALIAHDPAPLPLAVAHAMERLEGAFSVALLSEGTLVGFRDAHGIRPLALGRLANENGQSDWVLASETCALDLVGARFEREVRPGELVVIDAEGLHSSQARARGPPGALHLRARLLRAARLDARRRRGARRPGADGRAARCRGARSRPIS